MGTRDAFAEAEGKGNAAEINIGFYASVVTYKARLLNPAFLISLPILDNKFFSCTSNEGKYIWMNNFWNPLQLFLNEDDKDTIDMGESHWIKNVLCPAQLV